MPLCRLHHRERHHRRRCAHYASQLRRRLLNHGATRHKKGERALCCSTSLFIGELVELELLGGRAEQPLARRAAVASSKRPPQPSAQGRARSRRRVCGDVQRIPSEEVNVSEAKGGEELEEDIWVLAHDLLRALAVLRRERTHLRLRESP